MYILHTHVSILVNVFYYYAVCLRATVARYLHEKTLPYQDANQTRANYGPTVKMLVPAGRKIKRTVFEARGTWHYFWISKHVPLMQLNRCINSRAWDFCSPFQFHTRTNLEKFQRASLEKKNYQSRMTFHFQQNFIPVNTGLSLFIKRKTWSFRNHTFFFNFTKSSVKYWKHFVWFIKFL